MKTPFVAILLGLICLFPHQANSQNAPTKVLHVTNWPASAYDQATTDSLIAAAPVVPFIDTLTLGYGYRVVDQQPLFTYMFEWKPADKVYLDGQAKAYDKLSGDVYIESIVLEADVKVNGKTETRLSLRHDSLMSEVYPGLITVELLDLDWATFFEDTDANTAKRYFLEGFTLSNLEIAAVSFVYFDEALEVADRDPQVRRPRKPSRRTVHQPGVSIWIDIPFYGRPPVRRVSDNRGRKEEPRGDRVGRGSTLDDDDRRNTDRRDRDQQADEGEASGESIRDILKGKKKKDDDEEDEGELLPAAIAGVAAVAAVAVIGGTVGYYGNTEKAPIGLMTGYVEAGGGVLLQVAVNQALIERSKTSPEHLIGRVVSFVDAFGSSFQPALGIGTLITQQNNETTFEFSLSPGIAGNFGRMVLIGGYDVLNDGVDFGIAYNFRALK